MHMLDSSQQQLTESLINFYSVSPSEFLLMHCSDYNSFFEKCLFNPSAMSRLSDILPNLNRKTKQLPCTVKGLGQDHLHPLLEQLRQTCHGCGTNPGLLCGRLALWPRSIYSDLPSLHIGSKLLRVSATVYYWESSNFFLVEVLLSCLTCAWLILRGGAWSNESDSC